MESIDRDEFTVVLSGDADDTGRLPELHPVLKRWDHKPDDPNTSDAGALLVKEASGAEDAWIELEDGVSVQFPASVVDGEPNEYRTGDYWMIPARTATGDVLWPVEEVDGCRFRVPGAPTVSSTGTPRWGCWTSGLMEGRRSRTAGSRSEAWPSRREPSLTQPTQHPELKQARPRSRKPAHGGLDRARMETGHPMAVDEQQAPARG
ncbi:hypothetical protein G7085_06860 [Tessaracoccus sp. HDW20]|uniref:DUF6519 domain-containing protein n=1 Tax=Tessaracoccus coleopterorum TaxID=2714950 RepID=UPI0018D49D1C|nr:hypothetical protein [Tessaracoccus coleopterorum]